jgi:hypothetical protein
MAKLFSVIRIFIPVSFYAFFLLSGCKPTAYFLSPNEVQKEKVVLFLRSQEKITGEINISFENSFNSPMENNAFIKFLPEGKSTEEIVYLSEITGYSRGNDFYALKKVDLFMNNTSYLLFVKRLTGETSRIQLYELYESGIGNATNEVKYSYYLSLPSFDDPLETVNTRSSAIIPAFDQKMSEIVSDCPTLAKKIKSKDNGYFIPFATFNIKKHPDVLLKIINEYNGCDLTAGKP